MPLTGSLYIKKYIIYFNVRYSIQMAIKRKIQFSTHGRQSLKTLAAMIAAARKERNMSQEDLAQRLGVSRLTVRAIENGSASVAVGTVFEAAVTVGIPLLAEDSRELERVATSVAAITRVLPERVRGKRKLVNDDF